MNKKIKRIFTILLSMLLSCSLFFVVACTDSPDDDPPDDPVTITYTGAALPDGEVTVNYSASVATATGADSITYTMNKGALPAGITLGTDGSLSGRPTAEGDYSFTVRAASGTASATADFTLTINKHYYDITYSGAALAPATVDEAYTASVATATSTGSEAITYATEDTLPAGLSLASDGTISGTPAEATEGAVSFEVTASASDARSATATFSLTVVEGEAVIIEYTASALEDAQVGEAYTANIATATGAENIVYTLYGGALPEGIELSAAGILSGTPAVSDTYTFTVRASAEGAVEATAQFSLFVKPEQKLTEYTFEAEWTDLTGFQGVGISGSAEGTEAIESTTSSTCSNGYFVGWTHSAGISVTFVINSDADTTAKLTLSLGSEGAPMPVASSTMTVSVNGTDVPYDLSVYAPQYGGRYVVFEKYVISESINLRAGENVIVLTTADNGMGNGDDALGFMIDALFLETDAYLSWTPLNTEFTNA